MKSGSDRGNHTYLLIVYFYDTPGIGTPSDLAAVRSSDKVIRAHDCERNLASDFFRFSNGLFVFVLVGRCLKDVNLMVFYI